MITNSARTPPGLGTHFGGPDQIVRVAHPELDCSGCHPPACLAASAQARDERRPMHTGSDYPSSPVEPQELLALIDRVQPATEDHARSPLAIAGGEGGYRRSITPLLPPLPAADIWFFGYLPTAILRRSRWRPRTRIRPLYEGFGPPPGRGHGVLTPGVITSAPSSSALCGWRCAAAGRVSSSSRPDVELLLLVSAFGGAAMPGQNGAHGGRLFNASQRSCSQLSSRLVQRRMSALERHVTSATALVPRHPVDAA